MLACSRKGIKFCSLGPNIVFSFVFAVGDGEVAQSLILSLEELLLLLAGASSTEIAYFFVDDQQMHSERRTRSRVSRSVTWVVKVYFSCIRCL